MLSLFSLVGVTFVTVPDGFRSLVQASLSSLDIDISLSLRQWGLHEESRLGGIAQALGPFGGKVLAALHLLF